MTGTFSPRAVSAGRMTRTSTRSRLPSLSLSISVSTDRRSRIACV
jgi:hypothetical protein